MKKQLFILFGVGLLLAAASAYAQSIRVKANVPFDFIVRGVTLQAGEYTIEPVAANGAALAIRDADQKAKSVVLTNRCESLKPASQTQLVFHRYGNRYFLSEIWVEGNLSGHQLPQSPRETEMAMDYRVERVVVVAALR